MSQPWVEIQFDCVPLRTVSQAPIGDDVSPKLRQLMERVQAAARQHGTYNTYYLHRAHCTFRFTNDPKFGMTKFAFEGTVLTNESDAMTRQCELAVELQQETTPWLNEPMVAWLAETVRHAVRVEFDRYIAAGDLQRVKERLQKIEAASDASGGFVGMHL